MKKIIIINVDEDRLKGIASCSDENTVNEMICQEFGWMAESGIFLEDIADYDDNQNK